MQPRLALAVATLLGSLVLVSPAVSGASAAKGCGALTLQAVKADGYTAATGPSVTPYNYANANANAANAVGTTIDFGKSALIVGCLDPAHLASAWKAQGFAGKATTAQAFMADLVAASQGAMTATKVGGVTDYLDYGNGKEDGLGSLSKAASLRLDAWVANGKYVVLTFSAPAGPPSKALLRFISTTQSVLK